MRQPNPEGSSFAASTKKKELKKEVSFADAFPTLGETMNNQNNNQNNNGKTSAKKPQQISFSSVASKKAPEEKTDTSLVDNLKIAPGWVYIRTRIHNNRRTIEYKYGAPVIRGNESELAYQENQRLGLILFKYRIAREQYHRDMDVERLGDLSEFYGEPTLIEMYENDSHLHFNNDDFNNSDNDY